MYVLFHLLKGIQTAVFWHVLAPRTVLGKGTNLQQIQHGQTQTHQALCLSLGSATKEGDKADKADIQFST